MFSKHKPSRNIFEAVEVPEERTEALDEITTDLVNGVNAEGLYREASFLKHLRGNKEKALEKYLIYKYLPCVA